MEAVLKSLKGFLYTLVLFVILTLIVGLLIKITPMPEGWSRYYLIGILSIACAFIGFYSGCLMKKRGLLYGALYAAVFILVVLIIYMAVFATGITFNAGLLKYLICALFGSVGGMFGVNMRL